MTLIEIVKKAQTFSVSDAEGPGLVGLQPTWLDSKDASPAEVSNGELVSWWGAPAVSPLLKQREEQEELLSADLKSRPDSSLSLAFVDGLLRSYLEQLCSPNPNFGRNPNSTVERNSDQADGSLKSEQIASGSFSGSEKKAPEDSFAKLLKKASPRLGQKLLSLTLRACLISQSFDEVESILDSRALSGSTYPDLVPTLIDADQPALICVWVKNVCDPMFSDLLSVIKYLLNSSLRAGSSLARVRCQWRELAFEATQRLSDQVKGMEINRESTGSDNGHVKEEMVLRCIALSSAVDHFQPHELCLHYVVSFGHDETVLSSILSQLENSEALKLLSYLKKWLEQYSKRGSLCALNHRKKDFWVPLLGDILLWTSVLLDVHMTALVLCPDFHPEIQSVQLLIKGFVDDSHKFSTLLGATEHLRTKGLLPTRPSLDGNNEHVIEYLDI